MAFFSPFLSRFCLFSLLFSSVKASTSSTGNFFNRSFQILVPASGGYEIEGTKERNDGIPPSASLSFVIFNQGNTSVTYSSEIEYNSSYSKPLVDGEAPPKKRSSSAPFSLPEPQTGLESYEIKLNFKTARNASRPAWLFVVSNWYFEKSSNTVAGQANNLPIREIDLPDHSAAALAVDPADDAVKNALRFGVSRFYTFEQYLRKLIDIFWPPLTNLSIWDSMKESAKATLEPPTLRMANVFLSRLVKPMEAEIKDFFNETKRAERSDAYLYLCTRLNGAENYLQENGDKTAECRRSGCKMGVQLLPLYSSFVTAKLMFYQLGWLFRWQMNLTNEDVQLVKKYRDKTFKNARHYVTQLETATADHFLGIGGGGSSSSGRGEGGAGNSKSSTPSHVTADQVAQIITWLRQRTIRYGHEYVRLWQHIIDEESKEVDYSDLFVPSHAFVKLRASPLLFQALTTQESLFPLVGAKSQQQQQQQQQQPPPPLLQICALQKYNDYFNRTIITGFETVHENDRKMVLGHDKYDKKNCIGSAGEYLTQISIAGFPLDKDNKNYRHILFESLEIKTSAGNVMKIGDDKYENLLQHTYEMSNYKIAGIYADTDLSAPFGILNNLAVSFQRVYTTTDTDTAR